MSINDRFADLDLNDVTVTAAQLNTAGSGAAGGAAGVATASKATVLDANKAIDEVNTAKLSIGASGSEAEVTSTPAELNLLDGATAGTVVASKALVVDANKAIDEVNTAKLSIGATGSETEVTATGAELNLIDGTTIGTVVASKALAVDANKALDEINTAKLSIGATGSEVEVTATPAEIVRVCDKSASVVTGGGDTLAITEALHGDRIIVIGKTSGEIVTLPAATGTGNKYTFIIGVAATSNANIIKVANATDVFDGSQAVGRDADAEGATGYVWGAETNDDTLTMNGTATGGKVGDRIEVIDYKSGFFSVIANLNQSGGSEATPFSATVA